MKKYILLLATLATAFTACDYNDKFDGLEDEIVPPNIASYELTVTEADISTIVSSARSSGTEAEQEMAGILNTDKVFSDAAPANVLVPFLLKSKYQTMDVKSSALVTYNYNEGRNETVTALSTPKYEIIDADYQSVWGNPYATSFTPAKSPESNIPAILKTRFEGAVAGTYKNVEYYYSEEEPITSVVEGETIFQEDLETLTASSSTPLELEGWINTDLKGTYFWQCRDYNNKYGQVSAYNSKTENDIWLISKPIDLAGFESPKFSFDIVTGNYNGNGLHLFVSTDFDGNEANILAAKWDDLTNQFTIPEPAKGYSQWATAGKADLSAYEGKKVYIAFRYEGNDTDEGAKVTTTYQIDNIKVFEEVVGIAVEEKSLQYAAYLCDGKEWSKAGSDIITLQPEDYASMGGTYLSTANAATRLPVWMNLNFPYGQDGDTKIVAYKSNASTNYYADELVFDATIKSWKLNTFMVEKTDQFVYSTTGWVFDPTIRETLQKGRTETDDYMRVVLYVKDNQAVENPALVSSYGDSEYYYGFSGNYGNVSYREKDRSNDTTYPASGTNQEKSDFMNKRTIEGLQVFLTLKYPNATPEVGGIEQTAELTVTVYLDPVRPELNNVDWTYTFRCTGNKQWEFVQRESENYGIEKAESAE